MFSNPSPFILILHLPWDDGILSMANPPPPPSVDLNPSYSPYFPDAFKWPGCCPSYEGGGRVGVEGFHPLPLSCEGVVLILKVAPLDVCRQRTEPGEGWSLSGICLDPVNDNGRVVISGPIFHTPSGHEEDIGGGREGERGGEWGGGRR